MRLFPVDEIYFSSMESKSHWWEINLIDEICLYILVGLINVMYLEAYVNPITGTQRILKFAIPKLRKLESTYFSSPKTSPTYTQAATLPAKYLLQEPS